MPFWDGNESDECCPTTLDLLPGGELKVRCRRGIYYPFDKFDKFVVLTDSRNFNKSPKKNGNAFPFPWQSIAVLTAQFCCCGDIALPLLRHSSLTPTAQFSDCSGRTVPLEQILSSLRSFCVFDFTFFKIAHNVLVKPKMISLLLHFKFTLISLLIHLFHE